MSILVVPTRYTPHVGGIETLLRHTLPLLRMQGYEPVIATEVDDDRPSSSVVDGVPVYRLPFLAASRSSSPRPILEVIARLRDIEVEYDVTLRHVHGLDFGMFFVWRRHQRAPLPLTISVHGTLDVSVPFQRIAIRMLGLADVVTTVSNGVRESVVDAVPTLDRDRVRVIPNAIAVPGPHAPWPRSGHLFTAGRLQEQKGFDVAIEALARLTERHPDLCLHIAGDGDEEAALRRHARQQGVAQRVHFLGTLSHDALVHEISEASVVLVPSKTIEGFSLVALEAAHLGRPVVATRVGGLPETVEDGRTGVLVPPNDPERLATAIDSLLTSPGRARDLGERARERAARFDVVSCAGDYAAVYRSLGHDPLDTVSLRHTTGLVQERVGDESVVIDLEHGSSYGMAGTAADIWASFEDAASVGAVARSFASRYETPHDNVMRDVATFALRLQVAGLLDRVATSAPQHGSAVAESRAHPWRAPVLETDDDMAHLVLRDPAHLVDEAGWPHLPEPVP
jgi:glycosyltransferase involved in cell wall biosynthesis